MDAGKQKRWPAPNPPKRVARAPTVEDTHLKENPQDVMGESVAVRRAPDTRLAACDVSPVAFSRRRMGAGRVEVLLPSQFRSARVWSGPGFAASADLTGSE